VSAVDGSIRVQPARFMMGQAAGTDAMQSIHEHRMAAEINRDTLVEALASAGAFLPQVESSGVPFR
jgi:hypothetical protein